MSMTEHTDPFRAFDFSVLPQLHELDSDVWDGFRFDTNIESEVFKLADAGKQPLATLEAETFKLELEDDALPSTDSSSAASFLSAEESTSLNRELSSTEDEIYLEDIWAFDEVDVGKQVALTSWDHFENEQHVQQPSQYLGEAKTSVFDGVLRLTNINAASTPYVGEQNMIDALFEMGSGRSSQIFRWDSKEQQFKCWNESFLVSGFTASIIQSTTASLSSHGTSMRILSEAVVDQVNCRHQSGAGRSALLAALRSCHAGIDLHLQSQRSKTRSIPALIQVFQETHPLLKIVKKLHALVKDDPDDQELLSKALSFFSSVAMEFPRFEPLLHCTASLVAQPVLKQISKGIGLETSLGAEEYMNMPYGQQDGTDPLFVEIIQTISEAHDSLSLLQQLAPAKARALQNPVPDNGLQLAFPFQEIIGLQSFAIAYEQKNILRLVGSADPDPAGSTFAQTIPTESTSSQRCWELPSLHYEHHLNTMDDQIANAVIASLESTTEDATLCSPSYAQAFSMSITPMILAQHRLLSYCIFEVLFLEHHILKHLDLLHSFGMLGNGIFAARLGIALFDSEQNSGEAARHSGGITGLRLQTRDTWPPASSELRLVLMGILNESLDSGKRDEMTNAISFAIRDLSEEELDKCLDVNSIHALDFLKVQYRPPSLVLEAIISSETLNKYDRIFRHLLRILRLKFVAEQLCRSVSRRSAPQIESLAHRFRVEIHRFISVIADYSQNIATRQPWGDFIRTMQAVEQKLRQQDYHGSLRLGQSLGHLAHLHESTLDTILRALMLRQKQAKMLQLLQEVFDIILGYAALAMREDGSSTDESKVEGLYRDFKSKVKSFVRLLLDATDDRSRRGKEESELHEHLVLRLCMNEYWTK